jgi:hypothetical protein
VCRPVRTRIGPEASALVSSEAAASPPGGRGPEGEEKGVALGVDLNASLCRAGRTHDPPVLGERFVVGLVSDLLEKLGRAFDIGEEEGDSPGGEIAAHERSLARRSRAAKP